MLENKSALYKVIIKSLKNSGVGCTMNLFMLT